MYDEAMKLMPSKDVAALVQDLDTRGLLDETLIVLATEFGRAATA